MGKKKVIQKSEKELLEESEKIEASVKKGTKESASFIKEGRIYISSSYNNTKITLTDSQGNVLTWVTAGSVGFKGTKKGTSFAASKVAEAISLAIQRLKVQEIKIFVRGIGSGRESAIRALASRGLNIISIKDITPIPHNGCRPPKVRRV